MSSYQSYYLASQILSLALMPEKKKIVEEKLGNFRPSLINLISTGSNHLILPALFLRLRDMDLLPLLPEIITEHLEKLFLMNEERNKAIIEESKELALILEKANIKVMFLKGMGNIFDSLYTSIGERMVQDIDILIAEKNWKNGIEALIDAGFKSRVKYDPKIKPDRKHYPRLFRDDSVASVELHRYAVAPEFFDKFSTEEIWEKKVVAKNYPSCYVMCDEHKIIHNFIHSQLEHKGHFYARVFLRNLYDQFLLSEHVSPFDTLIKWGKYSKKTHAYLEILRASFFSDNKRKKIPLRKTGFYPLRFNLFLRYRFMSVSLVLAVKIYRSYIKKPILAFKDKELRQLLLRNLSDHQWYRKQFKILKSIIGRTPVNH